MTYKEIMPDKAGLGVEMGVLLRCLLWKRPGKSGGGRSDGVRNAKKREEQSECKNSGKVRNVKN